MESERESRPPRPPQPPTPRAPQPSQQQQNIASSQKRIQKVHDESYLYIEQGLSCDEQGQADQAVTLYNKGLKLIDNGLTFVRSLGKMVGPEWDKSNAVVTKMKKTKTQIESRVVTLMETVPSVMKSLSDPPPAYEESLHESMLAEDGETSNNQQMANAKELFKIRDGVQIFFINESGGVSAPSYPSGLGIYKFTDAIDGGNPPAFLKVGSWTYPLVPGHSPALHAMWGAYMFPDTNNPGSSVGVIVPDNVPHTEKQKLENFLNELTELRTQSDENYLFPEVPADEPMDTTAESTADSDRTSSKVAKGIVTAAEWISWGLTKGAEKTGVLMKKSSSFIQEKTQPAEQPTEIDPRAQQGVYYARQATGAAVKVSSYIVTKLGQGTVALARMAAPHVRAQGEKLLPTSVTSKDEGGHSKMEDVAVVAVGGLRGWATVYTGLETAAKALASSITKETVSVVKHKYGTDAGQITENGMFAAGQAGMAAYNFNNLGVKAIAKRAAKDTGKAVVEDYNKKLKDSKGEEAGASKGEEAGASKGEEAGASKGEEAGACGYTQTNTKNKQSKQTPSKYEGKVMKKPEKEMG